MGLCTKRRPWSNLFINANLVAPCFCFDRESCSSLFQVISSDFKTISTGSSFCTFGGVMYKTKTLVKFVHKRKSCCSLFLLWSIIMFQPFLSDFKTISRRFRRGLRFVLLVGLCTKRRPWSNSLITANLDAPCFCFDRESCLSLF